MRAVRPQTGMTPFWQVAYGLLVAVSLVFVGKCVWDTLGQSESISAAAVKSAPANSDATRDVSHATTTLNPAVEERINAILNGTDTSLNTDIEVLPNQLGDHNIAASAAEVGTSDVLANTQTALPESLPEESVQNDVSPVSARDVEATYRVGSPAIRQDTQLHNQMITPGNFEYLGGFRPEFGDGLESRFGLGGLAVTYRADGDADGPADGHPGSLFMVGHAHHQMVAEISIPAPVVSPDKNIDDLPVGKILQPFADITAGLRDRMTNGSSEPFEIGGLQVLQDRLHWTLYKYYNVTRVDYPSHGLSSVNLSQRAARGLWHLGPSGSGESRWHSYKNAGYITDVPQPIADKYLGGRNLLSGLQISTGRQTSSQGPALYAYRIDNERRPFGDSLDAIPLLWYPMSAPLAGHDPTDSWKGAAWLTLGTKQAIVVIGRKGHPPFHYGLPKPTDCYDYKGYHAAAYETQMLFYRPEDILAGAQQSVPNTTPWYRWNSNTPGGGIDRFMYQECRKQIGGMTIDRRRNILYIVEVDAGLSKVNAYERLPVVHAFRIVN